jgi:hypothetical protein
MESYKPSHAGVNVASPQVGKPRRISYLSLYVAGVPFQVFYGISNNARNFWGLANARRVSEYDPQDDSKVTSWKDIATLLMQEG